jgi:hypothetical protein
MGLFKQRIEKSQGKKGFFIFIFCALVLLVISFFSSASEVIAQDLYFPEPDPPRVDTGVRNLDQSAFIIRGTASKSRLASDSASIIEWTYHKTKDSQHPNGEEQQMVWLMNRARSNPTEEGRWLATTKMAGIANYRRYFGVDLDQLRTEFKSYSPKPPAAFDVRLYKAANFHSQALIRQDSQNYNGQVEAIDDNNFSMTITRGNVFAYANSGLQTHAAFNIDWGNGDGSGMQTGRSHRQAVMSLDGNFTNVGIAVVKASNQATQVGPLVIAANYCNANTYEEKHYNNFIVGTVWIDLNGNQFYDPDEGLANVMVTPDKGTYYAVTAAGGGYAIPVKSDGTYTVTFSGAQFDSRQVRTIQVSDRSVLLDLELKQP